MVSADCINKLVSSSDGTSIQAIIPSGAPAFTAASKTIFAASIVDFFALGCGLIIIPFLVFKAINPKEQPSIIVSYAISIVIVSFMCPIMSFIATIFISKPEISQFVVTWLQSMVLSFPMALCFQLFYAGPLVRFIFSLIFREKAK